MPVLTRPSLALLGVPRATPDSILHPALLLLRLRLLQVSTASGASSFSPLATWLDLSPTSDLRIDTSNTTDRAYLFIDVTGDGAADMVREGRLQA